MNERQSWAMAEVAKNGAIVAGALRAAFGVCGETARRDLAELVERGLLQPVGERRGRRYELASTRPATPFESVVWQLAKMPPYMVRQVAARMRDSSAA